MYLQYAILLGSLLVGIFVWETRCAVEISLNGTWMVKNRKETLEFVGQVPGGIFTDMMRNKLIGDPYYKDNDQVYKWIGRENWTYSREFEVDEIALNKKRIVLVAHGLDAAAKVFLNQNELGKVDNAFVRHTFDIPKNLLKAVSTRSPLRNIKDKDHGNKDVKTKSGRKLRCRTERSKFEKNNITIQFESSVSYAARQAQKLRDGGYTVPPDCPPSQQKGECYRNHMRIIQSSFSWDWGPSFPTQGIWKNIGLEAYDTAIIRDVTVQTYPLGNAEPTEWSLVLKIFFETASKDSVSLSLKVLLEKDTLVDSKIEVTPQDDHTATFTLQINIPENIVIERWWPNGHGKQKLYSLTVKAASGQEESTKIMKIGFRTVELVQEPLPGHQKGLSFYAKVNGKPIFCKGSNWIPTDSFQERVTRDRIEDLLESTRLANMNMIRIWGGGTYESDFFYDIADEKGIMIWHDFMFAVAFYPATIEFLNSVKKEATQQVRRLQHHPSIFLWAGNNENEMAITDYWFSPLTQRHKDDYTTLYIRTLKPIVLEEDPTRPYVASSPSEGTLSDENNGIGRQPNSDLYGDKHHYNYYTEPWSWESYPIPRFCSEYGYQSYSSFESLQAVFPKEDLVYPVTASMGNRQHQSGGGLLSAIDVVMPRISLKNHTAAFQLIIYLSQVYQAMAIKTETEHYLRWQNMTNVLSRGYTMGAMYWQLNDIWPAPTWSSLEYSGKWKMLQYYAKNFFSPLLVSPFVRDGSLQVMMVNDDISVPLGTKKLRMQAFSWASLEPKLTVEHAFQLKKGANVVYEVPYVNVMKKSSCSSETCFLNFQVKNDQEETIASNFLVSTVPRTMKKVKKANVAIHSVRGPFRSGDRQIFQITVSTDAPGLFTWLNAEGVKGEFSDNGIMLIQPMTTVNFSTADVNSPSSLMKKLSVTCLNCWHQVGFFPWSED